MRTRLIFPILAELARLDTTETQAVAGYDPEFQEPLPVVVNGARALATRYKDPIRLRAQFEDDTMDALQATNAGNAYGQKVALVFDYRDLMCQDLIDPQTGEPLINTGDKLLGLYGPSGCKLQEIRGGLWAIEVRPIAWGLGGRINLLLVRFEDRQIVGHDRP